MKYRVTDQPVSYKARLYGSGEVLEANEDEVAGFIQAGYLKPVSSKKRTAPNKRRTTANNK